MKKTRKWGDAYDVRGARWSNKRIFERDCARFDVHAECRFQRIGCVHLSGERRHGRFRSGDSEYHGQPVNDAPYWPVASELTATNIGLENVTLSWTPAEDDVSVDSYELFQNSELISSSIPADVLSYEVGGLIPDTTYTFEISARDAAGELTTNNLLAVVVKTLASEEAVEEIKDNVDDLVDSGVLNPGQGNCLLTKLDKAKRQIDRGQINAAINNLESFINEIEAMMNSGRLAVEEGQALIDAPTALLESIE